MNDAPSDLLTPEEAATFLSRPAGTLRQWRSRRKGPPYLKVEGSIRYSRADLLSWLAAQKVRPSSPTS